MKRQNFLDSKFTSLQEGVPEQKIFTVAEAARVLNLQKNSVYWILYNLTQQKRLKRVARGYYSLTADLNTTFRPVLSELANRVATILRNEGLRFYVTGLDILSAYFDQVPASYPPLVYVQKGSSDWALRVLEEISTPAVVNPKAGELSIAQSVRPTNDFIVIRETAEFAFVSGDLASQEKAFVDVYYEITRGYYLFPLGELAHILVTCFFRGQLNPVRMIGAARRRRIEKEIRYLLDRGFGMFSESAQPTVELSRSVQDFIRGVRQLRNQTVHGQNR